MRHVPTIDEVLDTHALALGGDVAAYRNHVYRVVNGCVAIVGSTRELEKMAVAAVFHDIGIWTHDTFDYIAPSVALARAHLAARGLEDWSDEITSMIADHHKITRSPADPVLLVEAFRQADWIDVTFGLRRFQVPRSFIRALFDVWPSAGFHRRLFTLALERIRSHPLAPLPMVRR